MASKYNDEAAWKRRTDRFSFLNWLLPPLSCAESKWGCRYIKRLHLTCILTCHDRRKQLGKFTEPLFYINYTYKNYFLKKLCRVHKSNGVVYRRRDGGLMEVTETFTLRIDPRGRFLMLRCAAIIVCDALMKKQFWWKPLAEVTEFLANYPTW